MKGLQTIPIILCFIAAFPAILPEPASSQTSQRKKLRTQRIPASVQAHLDVAYAGTKNPRQALDLFLPKTRKSDKPLPVVAFIHGGGWRNGDKRRAWGQVLRYAASGDYAAAAIGYRLSGEATWPAQIHDCKAAVRWLRANAKKYNLDPDRIGVMGSSAGGHLVAMLGVSGDLKSLEGTLGGHTDVGSRVACVVDLYGPTELLTMNKFPSRINHDSPNSPESRLIGGAIQKHKDKAREASPITHVSKGDAPFLIVHGSNDPLVPYNQSVRLNEALKKAGVSSLLIKIEGGSHGGFRTPELQPRIRKFLDRQLRGAKVDIAEEPIKQRPRRR